ncbi:5-oxoprolinase [Sphingobacterium hungaricum]|uniref:5-oxoprolinase n=1 Tax=Sphingobacterium hungaricum TaxID=2082723 RepID=A0A928V382_9SPHI|nr:5-oxoprolinase [Sphingobacterium hungaricum]MBE8715294.1 5-oxoprolinase [Sphingobacterium hungaricum]
MSAPTQLYQHLVEKFKNYSTQELITLNNDVVTNNAWGSTKSAFRTAILDAFSKRGLDLSHLVSKEDGFTSVKVTQIKLDKNVLLPLC